MSAPISTSTSAGLNTLLRTQQAGNVTQVANRQAAFSPKAASTTPAKANAPTITLSSANPPPSNLPRGSIVDKLV